jgi:calcineurin-like phosphoesterase family protein
LIHNKYEDSDEIKYLKYGDQLKVKGFNLAMHGDHGANGSRGTITQYKRFNFKMIHGHNHSPIIMDGVTSVGLTADVNQYYTRKGISTHAYGHALVHENGKRQLLVFDNNGEISDLI